MSSPTGPAEHCAGGSRAKSLSSLLIRFSAIVCAFRRAPHYPEVYSKVRPKFLIIPAAGKGCLFFSHRLCQTQAPPRIRPPTPPSRARGEPRGSGGSGLLPSLGPSGRAARLPSPCRNSTFSLKRSEVGPGGRGTEAGHGLRGRVGEWRKPLNSEKHREPEGDLRRKRTRFSTQHLHGGSQSSVTPVPVDLMPSGLRGQQFQTGSAYCPSSGYLRFWATSQCAHSSQRRSNRRIA